MFRLTIGCGQVDHRLTPAVMDNTVHVLKRDSLTGTGTIDWLLKEGLLCVCRIARQEVVEIVIHDNDRNVPWHESRVGTMTAVPSQVTRCVRSKGPRAFGSKATNLGATH